MSEKLNGNRNSAWEFFANVVAMVLLGRGLVSTTEEGIKFAESLDMSFEDLYANYPRSRWIQQIIRDCDEYEKDLERLKNEQ